MSDFSNYAVYHIYPLGFCGCPKTNDYSENTENRLKKIEDAIPHIKEMGFNAIYFGPVFQSVAHGYDTVDYTKIDNRLGTNADFAALCKKLHENDIKVILDGVFNHVGRDFTKFVEVRNGNNQYRDWFHINDGNSCYNDGFWYEGWEGHYELVKLNLYNPAVKEYLKEVITGWVKEFDIDGLRLDVAYCLDLNFLKELHGHCKWLKNDFWLMGETLHGDYNRWMNSEMLDSVTNYECYKGLYSSLNDLNLFEIAYSLKRQFGSEPWCLYQGKHLLSFVDNHDVTRAASILLDRNHLPLLYGLLFGMPGIPCIYYGSEWGAEGRKAPGSDANLRPCLPQPEWNRLTGQIAAMAKARRKSQALCQGDYREVLLTNRQYIFQRQVEGERVLVVVNADSHPYTAHFDAGCGRAVDLLTGKNHDFGGGSELSPYSVAFWRCER